MDVAFGLPVYVCCGEVIDAAYSKVSLVVLIYHHFPYWKIGLGRYNSKTTNHSVTASQIHSAITSRNEKHPTITM